MLYDTLERLTLEARIENDGTILGKLELKKKKEKELDIALNQGKFFIREWCDFMMF